MSQAIFNRDAKPIFVWLVGQDINIGDSLLRRPYLQYLGAHGPVRVFVHRASDDYLTGLAPAETQRVYSSFAAWYLTLLLSAIRRPTVLAFNAGEIRISARKAVFVLLLAGASMLCRIRGGTSLWLGASIQSTTNVALRQIYRLVAKSVATVRWRDTSSSARCLPRLSMPDWAFGAGADPDLWMPSDERGLAVFSLRGDRPFPSDEWLAWVRALLSHEGLQAVCVVQVRTDSGRSRDLSVLLGGSLVDWPATSTHAQQEAVLREVYGRSRVVVSDRLHALILGATEGAIPLGWVEASKGKIATHFDVVGLGYAGDFEGVQGADLPNPAGLTIASWGRNLSQVLKRARATDFRYTSFPPSE